MATIQMSYAAIREEPAAWQAVRNYFRTVNRMQPLQQGYERFFVSGPGVPGGLEEITVKVTKITTDWNTEYKVEWNR
jgi:predicted RNA-binding protein with PUA-like domain